VTATGLAAAAVHVRDGRIAAVTDFHDVPRGVSLFDVGDKVIMPGLVDTHVHLNEPGRTDWEGFETGTRAAAAGGVTTLIDMPLNSVPATTSVSALEAKRQVAARKCTIDVGFWGGVVPGNENDLAPLWDAGVFGFKAFLVPSGVAEFANVGHQDLERVMPILARLGATLLAHAELPGSIDYALTTLPSAGAPEWRAYATYLASRPPASEHEAIALLIDLSRRHRTRVHVVHLSSAAAVDMLRRARADGLPVSVETCPHYLFFAAEEIPDGATAYKCAPPIRDRANQCQLWDALREKVIDLVATDHSPAPPALKCVDCGDFLRAWGGIASLQTGLAAVWTAASKRGHTIADVVEWLCRSPARLAGLQGRKGALEPGCDADLVVFDPDAEYRVDPSTMYQRHSLTPYAGHRLRGAVIDTWLRGERVYTQTEGVLGTPRGQLLTR
jgi:allantoinase